MLSPCKAQAHNMNKGSDLCDCPPDLLTGCPGGVHEEGGRDVGVVDKQLGIRIIHVYFHFV